HTLKGHKGPVRAVTLGVSVDAKRASLILATGSDDTTVGIWDPSTGKLIRVLEGHTSAVNSVGFFPGAKLLVSGSNDHLVKMWDVSGGRQARSLRGHEGGVLAVAVSSDAPDDARFFLSAGWDQTIKLWNLAGDERFTLSGHTRPVR